MLHSSAQQTQQKNIWIILRSSIPESAQERRWALLLIGLVVVETILVLLALVPAQLWTRLLPNTSSAALDGPFPPKIAPVISALLYLLPTVIGFLSRSWQRALLCATLPAWIGLGAFLVAATFKVGAFYLVSADHVTANVSILELFAALGALGWLVRHIFKLK
ncbi:MAG TPA: hypothetical protein VEL31_22450 [Ktedonobacteraceae bacterium]|nr:hypothetical protein [Ktedonobacteraceae bacterium]